MSEELIRTIFNFCMVTCEGMRMNLKGLESVTNEG